MDRPTPGVGPSTTLGSGRDEAEGSAYTMTDRMDRLRLLTPPRLRSGWTIVAVIALLVLASWIPDADLPLGDSDDGRILGRFGLQARNF